MLVLGRGRDQTITIYWHGEEIQIAVVRIGTDIVKLGITAPKEAVILRDDAIVKHRKDSANCRGNCHPRPEGGD